MGNASMIKTMADMGFQPAGSIPKRNTLDTVVDVIGQFAQTHQEHQQKQIEQKDKAFGMYKTLRSSGYSSQKAHEIALKDYPDIPPPDLSEGQTTLDTLLQQVNIEQKQAQTKKIQAETLEVGRIDPWKEQKMKLDAEIRNKKIAADKELNDIKRKEIKAKIGKLEAEKNKIETETKGLGVEGEKPLTPDQQRKVKVGKRQIIQEIGHWGKTGQVYRAAEKDYVDIPDENSLKMFIINENKKSPYFDLDDPNIAQSIANAVKKRVQIDLTKDDEGKKVKGKSLVAKVRDWVFGERPPGPQIFGQALGSKENRFKELMEEGLDEDAAMRKMIDEGY